MEFDLNKRHCYYFNEISLIPRGSKNEKAISDYIVAFAKEHGLTYKQDDFWNVIVDKPATEGYENATPIVLQAHTDMVCEKNNDTMHDFEKDPLDLYVEDGWLKARGTTLGADDGYGVSYMLAILESKELKHPALSCIFTVQEEIGLVGALHLTKDDLHGERLINLDSGSEVETVVSSAGGARVLIDLDFTEEENNLSAYELEVKGLLGGHSGECINLERANANLLAIRILKEMQLKGIDVTLVNIDGGLKYNAIPREASVVFVSDSDVNKINEVLKEIETNIKTELEFSDPDVSISLKETEADKRIPKDRSKQIIDFLYLMPNGFKHKSMALDDLTTSSLNLGTIHRDGDKFVVQDLLRSAIPSFIDTLIYEIETLANAFGMQVNVSDRYGGWNYDKNSKLREKLKNELEKEGLTLIETASHGGLECGVFKTMKPELDVITYGPVTCDIHTPQERMDLASFDHCFAILCAVLEACTD